MSRQSVCCTLNVWTVQALRLAAFLGSGVASLPEHVRVAAQQLQTVLQRVPALSSVGSNAHSHAQLLLDSKALLLALQAVAAKFPAGFITGEVSAIV